MTKFVVAFGMAVGLAVAGAVLADGKSPEETPQPARVLAPAARIEAHPKTLVFRGPEDARRLIVSAWSAAGDRSDATADARLELPEGLVRLDADGYLSPLKNGEGSLRVSARGQSVEIAVSVVDFDKVPPVSFVRDVEPVINKVGCTSGLCHGAAKGKNGFRLSLRGYDPEFDYAALVDDLSGRRFNRADPPQSLLLLKPLQEVPHQGGFLFDASSRYYRTLHRWISEGVRSDAATTRRVARIELVPNDVIVRDPGSVQQLLVIAHYPEEAEGGLPAEGRDVTRDAFFTSSAFTVAEVSPQGQVTALRRGETAIIVRYEGQFATANVTVLGDRAGYAWKDVPEHNYIDGHIYRKLRKIEALPSDLASDEEFARRVFLDVIGLPPRPEETRAFLAEAKAGESPADVQARRDKLVDSLLERGEFADHWALKWSDLLQANRKYLGDKGVWVFRNWIRKAVASNEPFDRFSRQVLTGTGGTYTHPESSFWRIARQPEVAMETTTQLFLGVRFMCNHCHDHPFEQWTQRQYYELSAFFAETGIKPSPRPGEEVVYEHPGVGEIQHPKTGKAVAARFPFSYGVELPRKATKREELADWITNPSNPYFGRAVVNRVWSYFFGRGIIDPVDDIRASNPPANPELLQALTKDFISNGFDLRRLIRTIVTSRTYQLSVDTNRWNADDTANFSHQAPRRLAAEQLLDAINIATGAPSSFEGVPQGFLASQLPDSKVNEGGFLDLFGRPPRESPCECERRSEVSLSQALNLVNGPTIIEAAASPRGRIAQGLAAKLDEQQLIEELYLAALTRRPTTEDLRIAKEYLAGPGEATEKYQDLLWALINSPAFLFNR